MTPRNIIRSGGAILAGIGTILLIATGPVASALGALGGGDAVAGASDPVSLTFWFQLAFMRLFGAAVIGLGVVLFWCASHLTLAQHRSLARLLSVVLGGLSLLTLVQQIAIWNSGAGWVLTGALLMTALACAASAFRGPEAQPV
jgi:hypothetical protein